MLAFFRGIKPNCLEKEIKNSVALFGQPTIEDQRRNDEVLRVRSQHSGEQILLVHTVRFEMSRTYSRMTSACFPLDLKMARVSLFEGREDIGAPLWVVPLVWSRVQIKEDAGSNRGHRTT
jgi:hypothetical protein